MCETQFFPLAMHVGVHRFCEMASLCLARMCLSGHKRDYFLCCVFPSRAKKAIAGRTEIGERRRTIGTTADVLHKSRSGPSLASLGGTDQALDGRGRGRQSMKSLLAILIALACLIGRKEGFQFQDLQYNDLVTRSRLLDGRFARVKSLQELFGLDFVANDSKAECSPILIDVGDSSAVQQMPRVLISGEIHGDERIGPVASLAIAQLLVWSAECRVAGVEEKCVLLRGEYPGLGLEALDWLALLAVTRQTLVLPALNCLGHMQERRTERWVDPNRDFPYGRRDNDCLRSLTARALDRIMQSEPVQLVVTFHAGMEAIAYEWGSRGHLPPHDRSPDDTAHAAIGQLLRASASSFGNVPKYSLGRMNSLVYPVDGGMEDWLYAASWDKANLRHDCAGGSRLSTESSTSALVFLVETSRDKRPATSLWGGSAGILSLKGSANGHVPRNVRLGLMAIDLVQPYVCFQSVDIAREKEVTVAWYVGGGVSVNATFLVAQRKSQFRELTDAELMEYSTRALLGHPGLDDIQVVSPLFSGSGRWVGLGDSWQDMTEKCSQPYSHSLAVPIEDMVVQAWARVDIDFGTPNQGQPLGSPQSDLVRLRTTPGSALGGLRGRLFWPSTPVVIYSNASITSTSILHCASWPSAQAPLLHGNDLDMVLTANGSSLPAKERSRDGAVPQIVEIRQEIQESTVFVALERWYMMVFLVAVVAFYLFSSLFERLRRQRVYSSVSSNRYLSLPTGFQHV